MFDAFSYPFVQQGLWAVLGLSLGAGVLGTYVVLRGLAFFAHGVSAATFPGLVVAAGVGFAAPLGALGAAVAFTLGVGRLTSGREAGEHGTTTAMVLVGALATGVLLASDVFDEGVSVNGMLFGSLLLIEDRDIAIAVGASLLALLGAALLGERWLAVGFDREGARALGVRGGPEDAVLLLLVAVVAVAALAAVGSLLAAALMVVPAATVRPWVRRMRPWQVVTVLLTAVTSAAGLWVSLETDAPPGATIAVLSGALFALSLLLRALHERRGPRGVLTAVAAVVLGLGVSGCGADDDAGGRVPVVATTTQLADLARMVGGDAVRVHQVLHPNTDPHEYEPRPSDVRRTADARVVLASGDGLDDWVDDLVEQGRGDAEALRVGERVPNRRPNVGAAEAHEDEAHEDGAHEDHEGHARADAGHDHAGHDHASRADAHGEDHDHADEHAAGDHDGRAASADHHDAASHARDGHHHDGAYDPHWWQDPRNAIAAVPVIRDALIAAAPERRAAIERSARAAQERLRTLDREVAACIGRVPRAERTLVTSHDAFGHFTERYDIRVVGAVIPSTSTQAQASAGEVAELTRIVRRERVRAIFPEASVSRKLSEALARQTGADASRSLYGDALGPDGSDGATYVGAIRHNAAAMVAGFTGGAVRCTFSEDS